MKFKIKRKLKIICSGVFLLLSTSIIHSESIAYGAIAEGTLNPPSSDTTPGFSIGVVGDTASERLSSERAKKDALARCEADTDRLLNTFGDYYYHRNHGTPCEIKKVFKGCVATSTSNFNFDYIFDFGKTPNEASDNAYIKCINKNGYGNCDNRPGMPDAIIACSYCKEGFEPDSNYEECVKCSGNKISNDGVDCKECGVNQIPNPTRTACLTCVGDEVPNDQHTACLCPNGKEPGDIAGSCQGCESNEISDGTNSCVRCDGDKAPNQAKDTCVICPNGHHVNNDNSECDPCDSDEVSIDGGECTRCTGLKVPNSDKSQCEFCPNGYESNNNSECNECRYYEVSENGSECVSCLINYVPNSDKTGCELCPDGYQEYDDSYRLFCEECGPNEVSVSGEYCFECTGIEVPNSDKNRCVACQDGYESNEDNSGCIACTGNEVSSNGHPCSNCLENQVPNSDHSLCEICPDGHEPSTDNSVCNACINNEISVGGASCTPCVGNTVPNSEHTICNTCEGDSSANSVNTLCIDCESNEIMQRDGSCVRCNHNKVPNTEQDRCVPCTGGKVPNSENSECIFCSNGKRGVENSIMCTQCVNNEINPDGSCGIEIMGDSNLYYTNAYSVNINENYFVNSPHKFKTKNNHGWRIVNENGKVISRLSGDSLHFKNSARRTGQGNNQVFTVNIKDFENFDSDRRPDQETWILEYYYNDKTKTKFKGRRDDIRAKGSITLNRVVTTNIQTSRLFNRINKLHLNIPLSSASPQFITRQLNTKWHYCADPFISTDRCERIERGNPVLNWFDNSLNSNYTPSDKPYILSSTWDSYLYYHGYTTGNHNVIRDVVINGNNESYNINHRYTISINIADQNLFPDGVIETRQNWILKHVNPFDDEIPITLSLENNYFINHEKSIVTLSQFPLLSGFRAVELSMPITIIDSNNEIFIDEIYRITISATPPPAPVINALSSTASLTTIIETWEYESDNMLSYQWYAGNFMITNANSRSFVYDENSEHGGGFSSPLYMSVVVNDGVNGRYVGYKSNELIFDAIGTGSVVIEGNQSFYGNGEYTARIDSIFDANGTGIFNYQWYTSIDGTNFIEVSDATLSVFVLSTNNFNTIQTPPVAISVSVLHIDERNFSQSFGDVIMHIDTKATGEPIFIYDSLMEGDLVTIGIDMITDINGIKEISYQWQTGLEGLFYNITNSNDDEYTLSQNEINPNDSLRVVLDVIDYYENTTKITSSIFIINKETLGSVSILPVRNDFRLDGTLFIDTNEVNDQNGIEEISYISNINNVTITSTNNEIIIDEVLINALGSDNFSMDVVVIDSFGFGTTIDAVFDFEQNIDTTGILSIDGPDYFAFNEEYSANISDINDLNGLHEFLYQWELSYDGGINYSQIVNATNSLYVMSTVDFNLTNNIDPVIRLSVTYVDQLRFEQIFLATIAHANQTTNGDPVLVAPNINNGGTISINIDNVFDINGISNIEYNWMIGIDGQFNSTVSNDGIFVISTINFNPENSIVGEVVVTDDFNSIVTLTTDILYIKEKIEDTPNVHLIGSIMTRGATL